MLHPSLRLLSAVDIVYRPKNRPKASKTIFGQPVSASPATHSHSHRCAAHQRCSPPRARHRTSCRYDCTFPPRRRAADRNPITSFSHFVSCWASWQCRKRLWATTWWGDMGSQNITGQVAFFLAGRIIMGEPCHVIPTDGCLRLDRGKGDETYSRPRSAPMHIFASTKQKTSFQVQ